MTLSTAQYQALKADIQTNATLYQGKTPAQWWAEGNPGMIAEFYNQAASPAFYVWKSSVQTAEVGKAVNYVAVEAMTDANRTRITTFYAMNPSSFEPRSDIRSFWDNTFSGALGGYGQATRDALTALWKRTANRIEKLLATGGDGSVGTPATLTVENDIDWQTVQKAMAS